MSHAAMSWATRQRTGKPKLKVVLLALGDMADPYGVAFPSSAGLAEVTEQSNSTVREALNELESGSFIWRQERRRRNGSQASSIFVLAPPGAERGEMKDPRTDPKGCDEGIAQLFGGDDEPPASAGQDPAGPQPPGPGGCDEADRRRDSAAQTPEPGTPTTFEPPLNRHQQQPRPSGEAGACSEHELPDRAPVAALLATLAPLVAAGRLNDPSADGSDLALLVALEQYGEPTVRAAVDHLASWAADGQLRTRSLSRLLPSALDRGRRAVAGGIAATDRESWDEAMAALTAAVGRHGRDGQLDALRSLAAEHPAAAALVVEVGWRAWCDTHHTGPAGRQWLTDAQRRYAAVPLDGRAVAAQIALLEQRVRERAALAAGEIPTYDEPGDLAA